MSHFNTFKEKRKIIREIGASSPSTKGLLNALSENYHILDASQYLLRRAEYDEIWEQQANQNNLAEAGHIVALMLQGWGTHVNVQQQLDLHPQVFAQASLCTTGSGVCSTRRSPARPFS